MGTIYLLHFQRAYHHARHYLGWTENAVAQRLDRHMVGNGARLISVVTEAGIGLESREIVGRNAGARTATEKPEEQPEAVPDLLETTISHVNYGGRTGTPMTEAEAIAELTRLDAEFAQLSEEEHRHFENLLYLRAMVRGWTNDPLCQPATSVLAAYQQMRAERGGSE